MALLPDAGKAWLQRDRSLLPFSVADRLRLYTKARADTGRSA